MSQADNDEAKRALFIDMVRTALIVSHQSRNCTDHSLRSLTHAIRNLHEVSHRIPRRKSAEEAADEYITSQWPEFEEARGERGYVHPKWTGQRSPEEWRAIIEETASETLIDGVWQISNPEWRGLPGLNTNSFKLLVRIRKTGAATLAELMPVVPRLKRNAVLQLLREAEAEEGMVEKIRIGPSTSWRATEKLLQTRPASERSIAPTEPKPKPARVFVNRIRDPLLDKLLEYVRRRGQATNADVRTEFPNLPNYKVRRLLQQLREEGVLLLEGTTKASFWQPVKGLSRSRKDGGTDARLPGPKEAD